MITLEQYKEAQAACLRRTLALRVLAVSLFVVTYAIPMALAAVLRPYQDAAVEACAQWVVRNDVSPGLILPIVLLGAVLVGVVLALPVAGVYRVIDRRTRQDRRLFCPHCDARLGNLTTVTGYLVTVTGNCPRCGERVLDLPEESTAAPGPDDHLLTIEEYAAAMRDRFKRDPKDRDPRLSCPRCRASLAARHFLTVATRKCLGCQATVLEDPENTSPTGVSHPERQRLSLAGFRAVHRAYGRWGLFGGLLLAFLVWAPGSVAAVWLLTPLERVLDSVCVGFLALPLILLGAGLVFGVASLADRGVRRKLHVNCPHCGRSLHHPSGVVIATRRCWHCGRRALAEEENALSVSAASES
jgi:transcription elongation factor Elf1